MDSITPLIGILMTLLQIGIPIIIIIVVVKCKKKYNKASEQEYQEYTNNKKSNVALDSNGELKFPPYNEKIYMRKAKETTSGNMESFRSQCITIGFGMAGTIIGFIFCWIPLLLALLSYPFALYKRRKLAYKIYIDECEKIKKDYFESDTANLSDR